MHHRRVKSSRKYHGPVRHSRMPTVGLEAGCAAAAEADIPIVLMSGYVTAGLASRAQDSGVAEVLAKPLVPRDIARSLANAQRP
jgi:CheY-like chemotaxis protein